MSENYPTHVTRLWLDNDQGLYNDVTGRAAELYNEAADDGTEPSQRDMADWLKSYVEDLIPELPTGLASDLLTHAVGEIDWWGMAGDYLEEAKNEAAS